MPLPTSASPISPSTNLPTPKAVEQQPRWVTANSSAKQNSWDSAPTVGPGSAAVREAASPATPPSPQALLQQIILRTGQLLPPSEIVQVPGHGYLVVRRRAAAGQPPRPAPYSPQHLLSSSPAVPQPTAAARLRALASLLTQIMAPPAVTAASPAGQLAWSLAQQQRQQAQQQQHELLQIRHAIRLHTLQQLQLQKANQEAAAVLEAARQVTSNLMSSASQVHAELAAATTLAKLATP